MSALQHNTPTCRGDFRETKSRIRVNGKQKTVYHYTCTDCKAAIPRDTEGARREYDERRRFAWEMEAAQREAKDNRAAEAVIASMLVRMVEGLDPDKAADIADACIDEMRRRFLKISEDGSAKRAWQWAWQDKLRPVLEEIRDRIDDALPGAPVRLAAEVDDRNASVVITFTAPKDAPEGVLVLLDVELGAALTPVDGLDVRIDIRRAGSP